MTTIPSDVEEIVEEEMVEEEIVEPIETDESLETLSANDRAREEIARKADAQRDSELAPVEEEIEIEPEPEFETIIVMGKEQKVTKQELYEAGKRELQKDSAAAEKLRQASEAIKSLERTQQEAEALKLEAERILAEAKNPRPSEQDDAPDQEALIKEATKAVFSGDEEEVEEAFRKLLAGRQTKTTQPEKIDTDALVAQATQRALERIEGKTAIEKFNAEFTEIVADPRLYDMTDEATIKIADEHPDWSQEQIMFEAGKEVREWFNQGKVAGGVDSNLQAKEQNKHARTTPRAASARAPGAPVEKPKTMSDIVADMKRARGQF